MSHIRNLVERLAPVSLGGRALLRPQEGQTLVEYGLILGLIAIVVVVILTTLGTEVSSVYSALSSAI
jgi:pilus assembly protein Flp/PilA